MRGDSSQVLCRGWLAICCACSWVNFPQEPLSDPLGDKKRSATALFPLSGFELDAGTREVAFIHETAYGLSDVAMADETKELQVL